MGEALSSGVTQDQAMMYAAADTALEMGIEKLFGGIPFLSEGKISVKGLTEKYMSKAVEHIEKYDFKNAYEGWRKKVDSKLEITKDDMTQAQIVYAAGK